MDKTVASADEAIADLFDGATLMAGGFGLCGIPENLIAAIRRKGTKGLTIISNNCGIDGYALGELLEAGRIRRIIASYVGERMSATAMGACRKESASLLSNSPRRRRWCEL